MIFDETIKNLKKRRLEEEENLLEYELDELNLNDINTQEIDKIFEDQEDSSLPKLWKYAQNHPKELIIGDSS